ncbi:MAG: nickel-responsive transcriptional regulator NikR [Deferribacteraceae bacterium]|jgi:CopG family nickel-responsive transcriptional regulator|nr:nickel-responsive transcriptional regulator NikR [Deferribacteraceae bacterium]
MKDELVRFGVAMPSSLLEEFDSWLSKAELPNRSLAIRHLVQDYISSNQWHYGKGQACGSITLLYDHHRNDLSAALTTLQHDFGDLILCTTHVHMSHEICLECIIVKGDVDKLKELEEALRRTKGIVSVNAGITALVN